jgi:catechol 2,3-dioxygenase-like lactoylglutathione lyase family enzyme
MSAVHLFHYHLVTSKVREVEARYVGKLGFTLVARHGRIGEDTTSFEAGYGWEDLDRMGFKLRLTELERGAVNVVVQPGQWELPRVDHLGFALDEEDFVATLARAEVRELRVQEHGGRRTFVSTNAGYRLELHPPRDWLDDLLAASSELELAELHLRADDESVDARRAARRALHRRHRDGRRHGRAVRPRGTARTTAAARRAVRLAHGVH